MKDFKLTSHFWLSEFVHSQTAIDKHIENDLPLEYYYRAILVARFLEYLRFTLRSVIIVTSGYRSVSLNDAVGGVKNSWHTKMLAVDIKCVTDSLHLLFSKAIEYVSTFFPDLIIEQIHGNGYVHLAFDSEKLYSYFAYNV